MSRNNIAIMFAPVQAIADSTKEMALLGDLSATKISASTVAYHYWHLMKEMHGEDSKQAQEAHKEAIAAKIAAVKSVNEHLRACRKSDKLLSQYLADVTIANAMQRAA